MQNNEYNWSDIANQGSQEIVRAMFEASYGHIQMSPDQRTMLKVTFFRGFSMAMGLVANVVLNPNIAPANTARLMNQVDEELKRFVNERLP